MQLKEVTIGYGRKQNLGDYNQAHVEMTAVVAIDPGDDVDQVMRQAWQFCKENVRAQLLPLVNRQAARTEEVFLGLPVDVRAELS